MDRMRRAQLLENRRPFFGRALGKQLSNGLDRFLTHRGSFSVGRVG